VWATGSFLSSKLPLPEDPFIATTLEMLAGGALLLPIGLAVPSSESLDPSTWSWRSIVGLVYLVLIGSLVGYTAYVWLLGNLPISTVATYAYVNPVVAILLGVIFLNEGVTWQILVGAAVVLVSVALVIRSEAERVVEPFAE
jgi:drug/metabolite transporter (DMT)-like permease